jgi:hypothetical protein
LNILKEKVEKLKGIKLEDAKSSISMSENKISFVIRVKRGEDYNRLTSSGKCIVNFTAKW